MKVPTNVSESRLFVKLCEDDELWRGLVEMRAVVLALAETTARTVPDFTDHTIRHMDALWTVTDQILTQTETDAMNPAEAFLLGSAFYLHDIGMAYAATNEGLDRIRRSAAYKSFMVRAKMQGTNERNFEAKAVAVAVRALHADAGRDLATSEIPGSNGRFLFEGLSLRESWGPTCGEVASSHHWPLSRLQDRLLHQSEAPMPGNRKVDLLFVAVYLRIVDYAHINRDRAPSIDRAFRGSLDSGSLVHWLAQENIDGPMRTGNEVGYRAAKPIEDVEAWWLFFGMLHGLDDEIRGVRRLLDHRDERLKRLSLSGVRGAASPEEAVIFIPTAGFLPLEVNLRTGSIDRLVELLAGETLYGPNPMTAIRELIQNARDAVMLKDAVSTDEGDRATLSLPIRVTLNTATDNPTLEIVDHGIGMTRSITTDYLISIASDYWGTQFAADFPTTAEKGFKNAGRFGIGFLSVFMIASEVTVESNRIGSERYSLSLKGVGRRGELRQLSPVSGSGTRISLNLKPEVVDRIQPLGDLISIYAPTLPHSISVDVNGTRVELPVGWVTSLSVKEFELWAANAVDTLFRVASPRPSGSYSMRLSPVQLSEADRRAWGRRTGSAGGDETSMWPEGRPEYVGEYGRLIASTSGLSLLSLRGLAVQVIQTPGFTGVLELDSAALEVSRNRTVNADIGNVLEVVCGAVRPQVIRNLDLLSQQGLIIEKARFIASCMDLYGKEVVTGSHLPWISRLKIPGNVELINSSRFLSEMAQSDAIFVAYNVGPWTAMRHWAKVGSPTKSTEIAVVLDGQGMHQIRYRSTLEDTKIGPLTTIWPDATDNSFMGTVVELVSQAWQISPDKLLEQDGWSHAGDAVYGRWHRFENPGVDS